MEEPEIIYRQLNTEEVDFLNEVYRLRVLARKQDEIVTFEKYPEGWHDNEDLTAIHFIAILDGVIVGAIRINIYTELAKHPLYKAFSSAINIVGDVAYTSRLAVHPQHHNKGISKMLIRMKEDYCIRHNILNILCDVSKPWFLKTLAASGYAFVSEIDTSKLNNPYFASKLLHKKLG